MLKGQASVFDYLLVIFCEVVHVTLAKHLKCHLFSSTWRQISPMTQWPGFYWKIKHLLSSVQHSILLETWTRYLSWWQCWAQLYRWGEGPYFVHFSVVHGQLPWGFVIPVQTGHGVQPTSGTAVPRGPLASLPSWCVGLKVQAWLCLYRLTSANITGLRLLNLLLIKTTDEAN